MENVASNQFYHIVGGEQYLDSTGALAKDGPGNGRELHEIGYGHLSSNWRAASPAWLWASLPALAAAGLSYSSCEAYPRMRSFGGFIGLFGLYPLAHLPRGEGQGLAICDGRDTGHAVE